MLSVLEYIKGRFRYWFKMNGCRILSNGTRKWYFNGNAHREDGPAKEFIDGAKEWYINGQLHRLDDPARIQSSGVIEWWISDRSFESQEGHRQEMQRRRRTDSPNFDTSNLWTSEVDHSELTGLDFRDSDPRYLSNPRQPNRSRNDEYGDTIQTREFTFACNHCGRATVVTVPNIPPPNCKVSDGHIEEMKELNKELPPYNADNSIAELEL